MPLNVNAPSAPAVAVRSNGAGMFGMLGIGVEPGGGKARSVASAFGMMPPCALETLPVTTDVCADAIVAVSRTAPRAPASRLLNIITSRKLSGTFVAHVETFK